MNWKACLCSYSLHSYFSERLPVAWVAAVYIGKMPQDKEVYRTDSHTQYSSYSREPIATVRKR